MGTYSYSCRTTHIKYYSVHLSSKAWARWDSDRSI